MVLIFGVRCIFLRVVTFEYKLNSHNHMFHEMLMQEVFSSEINEIIVKFHPSLHFLFFFFQNILYCTF